MLLSGNIQLSLFWRYGNFYFYFKCIVWLRIVSLWNIPQQTNVYTTLNIICTKTAAPICILSKLEGWGCGCISVDFDVFGLFYLSGTVSGVPRHICLKVRIKTEDFIWRRLWYWKSQFAFTAKDLHPSWCVKKPEFHHDPLSAVHLTLLFILFRV